MEIPGLCGCRTGSLSVKSLLRRKTLFPLAIVKSRPLGINPLGRCRSKGEVAFKGSGLMATTGNPGRHGCITALTTVSIKRAFSLLYIPASFSFLFTISAHSSTHSRFPTASSPHPPCLSSTSSLSRGRRPSSAPTTDQNPVFGKGQWKASLLFSRLPYASFMVRQSWGG